MWNLTKLALRSRAVTIMLALLIAGASVWAFMGIKTELMPDISLPYTTIVTVYPQATPDAVVNDVSSPIEKAVWDDWSGKGLKHVTSTSISNLSVVMAEFEYGTDMTKVSDSITAALGKLNLPQAVVDYAAQSGGTANPQVIPINMNTMPLVTLGVSGTMPTDQLKQIVDEQIVPAISQIDGVLRVDAEGGDRDQIVILPDVAKMNQHGISMAQIAGLLRNHYPSLSEVSSTELAGGVTLGEIASINLSPLPSTAITRINGLSSISVSVVKAGDGNTVNVAGDVVAKVAELQKQLGDEVTITTISNQADFIGASISQLEEKAILGGILAVLVVFFFLWTVRASLITAISIPLSIFFGFLCMRLSGITINVITLSAMTIAVGRLIDDSIVIIEVIYRRMRAGEGFKEASIGGAKEVATPITSATLATIAIFVPLMFIGGIVGEMFVPFGLTVTFAMLASLLVALTLIPAMSKWLVSSKSKVANVARDNWYQKFYVKSLKWTLGHRIMTIVTAIVLLVGSVGLLSMTGTSFMSGSFGEETISIAVSLPPSADINATSAVVTKIETLLNKDVGVRTYTSSIGTSSSSLSGIMSAAQGGGGSNTAAVTVYLKSGASIAQEVANIDGACQALGEKATIEVTSGSSEGGGMSSSSSLSLSVQGENQANIAFVTAQLIEKLNGVAGLTNLKSDLTTVIPQLNIALDQSKLAISGLPPAQMAGLQQEFMLLLYGGTLPGKTVSISDVDYSIYIKSITSDIESVEQANSLKIGYPVSVNLSQVAKVTLLDTPSHISHTDTVLSATITGTITDKNVGAVNTAIQVEIDALPAHPGVEIKTSGIAEMMADTFTRMGIAILLAIVLVFAIVIAMMRSLVNPLIIMASIPFAFIGSILALLITGNTLGVSAMMGMLMLVGIVLTNAIVLVSMVEHLRKSGQSVQEALVEGGKTRLRPIIMTALTTILAMIPMAIIVSSGTMLSAELAIVVIGGMITSTFLTLFVIPAIYSLVHQRRKKPAV
jgi:HAE1 family hydrophobic/amphiphilic exporter-1